MRTSVVLLSSSVVHGFNTAVEGVQSNSNPSTRIATSGAYYFENFLLLFCDIVDSILSKRTYKIKANPISCIYEH